VRSILKWALRLFLLALVLVVLFFLSLDTLLRTVVEHNLRAQTGMVAQIGRFHLGLTEPVVEIKNLQLYNTKQFGGAPFLNIPEIHVEYDRAALAKGEIHLTLLRFNLGELDVVKSQDGQTNLLSLGLELPTQKAPAGAKTPALPDFKRQTGLDFKGIDCLTVSVGTFKYVDLQNQKNNQEQKIGVENFVVTNVVSAADLAGLGLLVGLRSGDVFKPLIEPGDSGAVESGKDLLKILGR
jgi:hypothetical protein